MKDLTFKKIQRQIRSFDLCALIRLLQSLGIPLNEIYFESNLSYLSSWSLCENITFSKSSPRVRITINMGLFSNHSSLPSYFMKYVENEELDGKKFLTFLSFFNHHLIKEFLRHSLPEKNTTLFANWRETHYYYLSLLGFESISTLSMIFNGCFPELQINVKKKMRAMRLHASTFVLGKDSLASEATIGEKLEETLASFEITLTTEEEISQIGTPWPVEINRRLYEWIVPILRKTDLHLSISLIIKNKYLSLHLSNRHYLGFDRMGHNSQPFYLLLFHDFIKKFRINTFLAENH